MINMEKLLVKQDIPELGIKKGNIILYNPVKDTYYFNRVDEVEDTGEAFTSYKYSTYNVEIGVSKIEDMLSADLVESLNAVDELTDEKESLKSILESLQSLNKRVDNLIKNK